MTYYSHIEFDGVEVRWLVVDGVTTRIKEVRRSVNGIFGPSTETRWRCACGWSMPSDYEQALSTVRFHVSACPAAIAKAKGETHA